MTDMLDGVTVEGSGDYERRQVAQESDSAAERLAGMVARRSGAHKCPKDSGGTYLACLDRNHRRDRHNAGYLLRMILADPENTGLAGDRDYKSATGWYSMSKEEAKNMRP